MLTRYLLATNSYSNFVTRKCLKKQLPYFLEISQCEILFQGPVRRGNNSGQLDIEGGVCSDQQTRCFDNQHCSLFVRMNIARALMHIVVDPLPCGKISRVAFNWDDLPESAARFRGNTVYKQTNVDTLPANVVHT